MSFAIDVRLRPVMLAGLLSGSLLLIGCGQKAPRNEKVNGQNAKQIVAGMSRQQVEAILGPGVDLLRDNPQVTALRGNSNIQTDDSWSWVVWESDPGAENMERILV